MEAKNKQTVGIGILSNQTAVFTYKEMLFLRHTLVCVEKAEI